MQQHNSSERHNTQLESALWRSCIFGMHMQQHNSSGRHKTAGICSVKKLYIWHAHATAQQFRTTQNSWNLLREEAVYLACTCNSTTVQDDTKQLESALWRSCQLGMQVKQFRMNIHNWNHLSEEAVNWAWKSVTTQQFRTTQYTTGISSVKKLSNGPARVKQHNSLGRHNTQLESSQWRSCQLGLKEWNNTTV